MRAQLRKILSVGNLFGLNFTQAIRSVSGIPRLVHDAIEYRRQSAPPGFQFSWRNLLPMLSDFRGSAGAASGHYLHQDLWAARRIFHRCPRKHVDIGSRIDGFVTHLLVFMDDVRVIDIRPLDSKIQGLYFLQDDATSLKCLPDNSVESISSLHVAEHFGLGRYSDPVDPWAHLKFMRALERVLAPGGYLYFSVPIGREQRVEFNAHRVFDPNTVLANFQGLELASFSCVDDEGDLHTDVRLSDVPLDTVCGCGLFEFKKR